MTNANEFHVIGIDENDGQATVLHEAPNSGEAKDWMIRYASKENAGGWKRLEVIDTRGTDDGGCAETVFIWDAMNDEDVGA